MSVPSTKRPPAANASRPRFSDMECSVATASQNRRLNLAACAVVFATALGSSAQASPTDLQAIQQIEHYCTASWRNAGIARQDWQDCTQQALLELLESLSSSQLNAAIHDSSSSERRELNRAVWRTAKRWQRSVRPFSLDESRVTGQLDVPATREQQAWEQVVAAGANCLSTRQQEILRLLHDGWAVHDIASEMQLTPARVSDEKYKAIAKLREELQVA